MAYFNNIEIWDKSSELDKIIPYILIIGRVKSEHYG
jgi:hypothetical protein